MLDRVAQHLVGLVDFLELLFRLLLVLRDVRMEFARELAKSLLDFRIARPAGHTQGFVVVFILHRHNQGWSFRHQSPSSSQENARRWPFVKASGAPLVSRRSRGAT